MKAARCSALVVIVLGRYLPAHPTHHAEGGAEEPDVSGTRRGSPSVAIGYGPRELVAVGRVGVVLKDSGLAS